MSWGIIYKSSWWGRAIKNDFGEVYEGVANPSPIEAMLSSVKDRATYYENDSGTIDLLKKLEGC